MACRLRYRARVRTLPLLLLCCLGCRIELGPPGASAQPDTSDAPSGEVWVYTSMYRSVIERLDEVLADELPHVQVKWYPSGSEKVAQRVEAEWSAGGSQACLLLTSDPFWYADLKARGRLMPYLSPNILRLDRGLVDPDGAWAPARLSLMVMARNERSLSADAAPERIDALMSEAWGGRTTFGDPLSSGTAFTTLAFLQDKPGWEALRTWRAAGLVAAGGNGSVISRLESGEREVGVVLLENILMAGRTSSPVVPIFPRDGAIVVPGPIALTSTCPNPKAARAVYDVLLSQAGQHAMTGGFMYAALPDLPPPPGAPPLSEIETRPWSTAFTHDITGRREQIKERWSTLMDGE